MQKQGQGIGGISLTREGSQESPAGAYVLLVQSITCRGSRLQQKAGCLKDGDHKTSVGHLRSSS